MAKELCWKVHTPNLFKEIVDHALPRKMGVMLTPINQFRLLLSEVAERASELNDPKLNALMCRMTLYEIADPESSEYDKKTVDKIIDEGMKQ